MPGKICWSNLRYLPVVDIDKNAWNSCLLPSYPHVEILKFLQSIKEKSAKRLLPALPIWSTFQSNIPACAYHCDRKKFLFYPGKAIKCRMDIVHSILSGVLQTEISLLEEIRWKWAMSERCRKYEDLSAVRRGRDTETMRVRKRASNVDKFVLDFPFLLFSSRNESEF